MIFRNFVEYRTTTAAARGARDETRWMADVYMTSVDFKSRRRNTQYNILKQQNALGD